MSNLAVQTTTSRPHYGLGNEHPITEKKSENTTWFSDWLNNDDKVCTDGFDDGSLSLEETAESFGKGLIGIVKTAVNHPIATGLTLAAGIGLTVLTGGAAAPILVAAGATIGTGMVGYGAYKAATAETDAEAKQAWETIGNGTFAVATSALSAKASLNAAAKAGVTQARGANYMNTAEQVVQCFKVTPEAVKVSGANIVENSKAVASAVQTALGTKEATTAATSQAPKQLHPISEEFKFEIKPGMEQEFKQAFGVAENEIGYTDLKKIIAGLEELNTSGNMNVKGYAELAKTIDPDMPGCYWSHALNLYNKYGVNANIGKVTTAASQYLRGVSSVNSMSGAYRIGGTTMQGLSVVGVTNSVIPENK